MSYHGKHLERTYSETIRVDVYKEFILTESAWRRTTILSSSIVRASRKFGTKNVMIVYLDR